MQILTPLKIAYKAIKIHKVRSFLTVLGLMIGVVSIIIVINLGSGINGFILNTVEVFGTDYLEIEIKVPSTSATGSENAMGLAQGISITTLTMDDAEAVAKHPNITDYYAGIIGQDIASFGSENKTTMLWGMTPSFFGLYNGEIEFGRAFDESENNSQARVAVIGHGLAEKFFGDATNAVNNRIKIGKKSFRVIGVMEEQGSMFFMDFDNSTYMPVQTLQKQILGINHIQFIIAYMKDLSQAEATVLDVTGIMRDQHEITDPNKDDFLVITMEQAMEMVGSITGGITLLLAALAAISLLVGGVGIMNIMYVSVAERTYEIGLRKAVGATNNDIMWQFLWEAVFLTVTGGIVGIIIGEIISLGAMYGANVTGLDWGYTFSNFGIILGVGFSCATGLIFGIYPAKKAADLEPVDALQKQ
ncbi:ABC transporter permease [Patescibacteria group bacterium]|nr:ABC transporter permease [Patescibacteria group bacterium]